AARVVVVAPPDGHNAARPRLLHAAQHAANQRAAADAAGARYRSRPVLFRALCRPDRRRCYRRRGDRSHRRAAIVSRHCSGFARTCRLVRARAQTLPAGVLTARRRNLPPSPIFTLTNAPLLPLPPPPPPS